MAVDAVALRGSSDEYLNNPSTNKINIARQCVFDTTELLEAILLEVDIFTTLVACTRVSKTFANTISSSIALQRALWFQPTPASLLDPDTSKLNPFFVASGKNANFHSLYRGIKATQSKTPFGPKDGDFERILESTNCIALENFPPRKHQYGSWRRMIPMQDPNEEGQDPHWVLDFRRVRPDVAPGYLTLYHMDECSDSLRSPGDTTIAMQGPMSIFGQQKKPPTMEELIMFSATNETKGNWDELIRIWTDDREKDYHACLALNKTVGIAPGILSSIASALDFILSTLTEENVKLYYTIRYKQPRNWGFRNEYGTNSHANAHDSLIFMSILKGVADLEIITRPVGMLPISN
ncbi:uncharacterized protein MYCFIDRAFT_179472 [Pseudocercospora fijiensis CIRAD86]|uniref:F-box domain-containing protein n=1 Tax=Pseudocercospora fijiensis (strain CIRAD86) TaxID=383855 RepID=M2ZFU8_PSEFD|nr:uncharacterized protein MYCFIDRAFT_179472 [Pseudocercospora fijiensis CIRAD86]EME78024.1 hypothetical protein MYCFIDRAFT_179472 [Pseudocercospora fijiensis CIRAD86]